MLHRDNIRSHTDRARKESIKELEWELLEH
jgi:hypothetical protein